MKRRVGIYLRVSTDGQTTENQRRELEAVAARSGWEVVGIYCLSPPFSAMSPKNGYILRLRGLRTHVPPVPSTEARHSSLVWYLQSTLPSVLEHQLIRFVVSPLGLR
jgi:hypothetical protein